MNLDLEINNAENICILGHVNPDGDCVGSTLSLYNYIKSKFSKKNVEIFLQKSSNKFSILYNYDKIVNIFDENKHFDLAILLDSSSLDRIGEFDKYFINAKRKIAIDHHITNNIQADDFEIKPEVSSTCEICFSLYDKNFVNKEIAECLYLGIIHDTGIFRYKSTTKQTLEIAAYLIDKKIDFNKIQEETYYCKTFNQQKVTGFCLERLEQFYDNKVVYTYLTLKEQATFHVSKIELDNIIAQIRETNECICAIFAYETVGGLFKISMRSTSDSLDVSKICMNYGGGGHKAAAGCSIKLPTNEIIQVLLEEIKKQI